MIKATIHRQGSARPESGQVIAIYAVSLLLLALMTFFTVAVGVKVREKIKVQAAADASAYGLAVAQARAMNYMAWTNRAIVSEYVSALSIIGHESFLSRWEYTLKQQEQIWYWIAGELVIENAACPFTGLCCDGIKCAPKAVQIAKMWRKKGFAGSGCPASGGGGLGSYDCAHAMWHKDTSFAKALHAVSNGMDNGYIGRAALQYGLALAVNLRFGSMLTSAASFAEANGKAVDPRIGAATRGKLSPGTIASFQASFDPWPPSADWDDYHEILTGTRTDWILDHNWAGGYFWADVAKEAEMFMSCGLAFSQSQDSGGAMMTKKEARSMGIAQSIVHGRQHAYNSGNALGEGGRLGMVAEDHGGTQAEAITYGGCFAFMMKNAKSYSFLDPHCGGHHHSVHAAPDGFRIGEGSGYGENHDWEFPYVGILSNCGDPGASVGFYRYKLENDANKLFNQPHTFAAVELDTSKDAQGNAAKHPWDMKLGRIGGSLLTVDATNDPNGRAQPSNNDITESLPGQAYDTLVYPKVRGFSSGLTYYHNPNDWREVPTLWNPFWRAKLHPPQRYDMLELGALTKRATDNVAIERLVH